MKEDFLLVCKFDLFICYLGSSEDFFADRIRLNTNTSTVVPEDGPKADALIFIRFPPGDVSGDTTPLTPKLSAISPEQADGRHQKASNVSLGFVLYQNDRFFRSKTYDRQRVKIRVLSGKVMGQELQHVEMLFRPVVRKHFTALENESFHGVHPLFWSQPGGTFYNMMILKFCS